MDERTWAKARSLADRFGDEYDEDVALVLGEGLLEALAELLPMEQETVFAEAADSDKQFTKMQAKVQHPAFIPAAKVGSSSNGANEDTYPAKRCELTDMAHFAHNWFYDGVAYRCYGDRPPKHPEFLEGRDAYEWAPVGTQTNYWEKDGEGWFRRGNNSYGQPSPDARIVIRWGNPS